jgi:hypothetical protein
MIGLKTKGRSGCILCRLLVKWKYSNPLKKSVYGEFHQFMSINHPFCMEFEFNFNGVYEMSPPPPHAIAKDWLNTWNALRGLETPTTSRGRSLPPGMNRLSVFHELKYWSDLLVPHCLDPMHIFKNVSKSFFTHLLGEKRQYRCKTLFAAFQYKTKFMGAISNFFYRVLSNAI